MMQATRARAGKATAKTGGTVSEKHLVESIFEAAGLPGWLGWGTYGAESTYGTNGSYKFGGIDEPHGSSSSLQVAATESAKNYAALVSQYGSVAAAVPHYSGNSYTVSHVEQLGKGASSPKGAEGEAVSAFFLTEGLEELKEGLGELGIGPGAGSSKLRRESENPVGEAGQSALGAISSLSGFLELLTSGELWLRVGEILAGAVLIFLGLKALTGAELPSVVPVPV